MKLITSLDELHSAHLLPSAAALGTFDGVHRGHQEDLISIGTIGLIKGISSFDPSKGAKLATYAARCIENAILSQAMAAIRAGEKTYFDSVETTLLMQSNRQFEVVPPIE